MVNISNISWLEKYRPKTLDEIVGQMEVVVVCGGAEVSAGLKVKDGYPLMFVKGIKERR